MTAAVTGLSGIELLDHGLGVLEGNGISGTLEYERPAFTHDPLRVKDCTMGAFSYINGHGSASLYRCRLGRYAQIGEAAIVGAPEHPVDWFSSHPFAFTRPEQLPRMYRLAEFARLAPDGSEDTKYTDTVPSDTYVGHEAYIGAGSYVKRGVTIGDGAVVGAGSVVTRDVPPYAVVSGTPARIQRMRFSEDLVERFLALEWWRYDLAPYKHQVNFSKVEETLAYFEARQVAGELEPLRPGSYRVRRSADGFEVERLPEALFFPARTSAPQASTQKQAE